MTASIIRVASWLGLGVLAIAWAYPARASEENAWAALRSGAVVIFRHANAPGVGDPEGFRLDDCATQRNLGEAGRRQAMAIGERLRSERIPIAAVLSSQWCRARDTAQIAFPGQVRLEPAFNSFFDDRSRSPEFTDRARAIVSAWRGPGTMVIVTHQVNISALTAIAPADGEGIVLRPRAGGFDIVGRIRP